MEIKENQGAEVQTAEPMKFKVKVKRKFSPDVPLDDVTEAENTTPAESTSPADDDSTEKADG